MTEGLEIKFDKKEARKYFMDAKCQFCKEGHCALQQPTIFRGVGCDGHNGKFHCPFWGPIAAKLEDVV